MRWMALDGKIVYAYQCVVDVCQCGGVHWHTYPYTVLSNIKSNSLTFRQYGIGKLILQASNYQVQH